MHMTSAPHLLNEDRPEFGHVLDEALRIVLDDMSASAGSPLNAEQLRTMALAASDVISAAAADEYEAYRKIRAEARAAVHEATRTRDTRRFGYAAMGVADGAGSGAGLVAVLAVLTPLLAGAAAVIFLIIGYALQTVSPEPGIAAPLRTAGWFFAATSAAAILLGAIGLLLTALRDSSSAIHDTPDALPDHVVRARDTWRRALLDRGLLPFLDNAVRGEPLTAPVPPPAAAPTTTAPRIPRLGYSRPDYSTGRDRRAD